MIIWLADRVIIELTGADCEKLLQGIITANVDLLKTQSSIFSALLTPQGKFLHDFFVVKAEDSLLIDVEARQAEGLVASLKKYRLRAKVEFATRDDLRIYYSSQPLNEAIAFADIRKTNFGWRNITATKYEPTQPLEEYHYLRIGATIPEGFNDLIPEKSYLLENNYDLINAVDFNKGCYVGQEVTARSKYRGVVRKKIFTIFAPNGEKLPEFGTKIMAGGIEIGEIRSSVRELGLAQLRVEELENAQNNHEAILAGEISLKLKI